MWLTIINVILFTGGFITYTHQFIIVGLGTSGFKRSYSFHWQMYIISILMGLLSCLALLREGIFYHFHRHVFLMGSIIGMLINIGFVWWFKDKLNKMNSTKYH